MLNLSAVLSLQNFHVFPCFKKNTSNVIVYDSNLSVFLWGDLVNALYSAA